MIKKIFIMLIFIVLFFGVTKVQAISENEEVKLQGERITEFDGVIKVQELNGEYRDLTLTKYAENRNVHI